ncbi:MAG: ComEC/Rec2 family competence protein [Mangrovibacterium sp.]
MKFFRNYPFVKLLSFQLTGIWIANFFPAIGKTLYLSCLILVFLIIKLIRQKKYPCDLFYSALLCVLMMTISFIRVPDHQSLPQMPDSGINCFSIEILCHSIEKINSLQTVGKIVQSDSPWYTGKKVVIYLKKGQKSFPVKTGDQIIAKAFISEIKNAGNPYEFNYKNYMARKQIRYGMYLDSDHYLINENDKPSIGIGVKRFQEKLVSKLKEQLSSDQAYQVIAALTLGYRNELTRETQSHFITTGAMHILSVSGLHVAMIFLFLNSLLSFLKRSNTGKVIYFFVMITCLWGYALLTGFSPPVQRAVIMFSFILIGNSLNRPASIYNSIAASAFFLLFFDPDLLFDVGFQLSYMAVISIVFFYPKLTGLLRPKNKLLKYSWQLCCISLAAQIGAFPLSIYYFNQFPVYFWLSNFVVVPAGYLILALTGAFFMFSYFSTMTPVIAKILCGITDSTLFLLRKIGELPFAVIDGLSISLVQFICLFLVLGVIPFFIVYKKHTFLFAGMLFLLLFQVAGLTQKIGLFNQRILIVYQSKEKVIHLINGRTNYLITNSDNPPDPFLYKNVLLKLKLKEPFMIYTKLSGETDFGDLIFSQSIIQFTDKSLLLDQERRFQPSTANSLTFSSGLLDLNHTDRNRIHLRLR